MTLTIISKYAIIFMTALQRADTSLWEQLIEISCGFEPRRLFNRRRGEIGRRGFYVLFSILSVYFLFIDKQQCRNRLLRFVPYLRIGSLFRFRFSLFSYYKKSKRALQLSDTSPVKREVAGSSPAAMGYALSRSSVGRALIILMMILSRLFF